MKLPAYVWVVMAWNTDEDPQCIVLDNEDAALSARSFYAQHYRKTKMDRFKIHAMITY